MIECTFEAGNTAHLRHTVVDAVMVLDNKVLLTKRSDTMHAEGGKWAIPGGYIDRDETAVEAVMREVLEETGYTCEVVELLTIVDKPDRRNDERQNISFVFITKPISQVGEMDTKEVSEVKWFPLDALPAESDIAFDHLEIIWQYIEQQEGLEPA